MSLNLKTRWNNLKLVHKYPFLYPRNVWTGKKVFTFYEYTMFDFMPKGWRKAFGLTFCEELKEALHKLPKDELKSFWIYDIKEKYGTLRISCTWYTKEIDDVISKYEKLSQKTCINCGKPAEVITRGWISPYCKECIPNNEKYDPIKEDSND